MGIQAAGGFHAPEQGCHSNMFDLLYFSFVDLFRDLIGCPSSIIERHIASPTIKTSQPSPRRAGISNEDWVEVPWANLHAVHRTATVRYGD